MTELSRKIGEMEYDGLITDQTPPIQVRGGVIAKLAEAAVYKRGTVLAKSSADGKLYILGAAASAEETAEGAGENAAEDTAEDTVENTTEETPAAALTPDCILCDDTEISADADTVVTVYTAGCFDSAKVTVSDGYVITEADRDKLRERGIVFKDAFPAN